MSRCRFSVSALVLAMLVVPSSGGGRAWAAEDLVTPRSLAMGNSLRADASGALGPLLNPASMALRRNYTIEAMYGFRVQGNGSTLLASIVDSVTSRVAAGVYYSYVHASPHLGLAGFGPVQPKREGSEAGLALAVPLGERFALGLTGKYVRIATIADPKDNPGLPMPVTFDSTTSAASADGFTLDAGLALRLGDSLTAGVAGYNLIPLRSIEAPISLGTGLAYHLGTAFTAALDFIVDFNKYKDRGNGSDIISERLGGGIEYLAGGKVAIRAGSYWDSGRPAVFVSGGLAYVGQSFAIDLGYRQQVSGGPEATLVAGIRVFLE